MRAFGGERADQLDISISADRPDLPALQGLSTHLFRQIIGTRFSSTKAHPINRLSWLNHPAPIGGDNGVLSALALVVTVPTVTDRRLIHLKAQLPILGGG